MGDKTKAAKIHPRALKNPLVFIALGFGSGLAPVAPGTAGTLVAIPIYLVLQHAPFVVYVSVTLAVIIAGIWLCSYTATKLGVHDHPAIVIDEIAGFLVTMLAVPPGWLWVLLGFVLFRLFDAIKPWPISWMDRNLKGGTGIMLDDIAAGLVSLAILHVCVSFT